MSIFNPFDVLIDKITDCTTFYDQKTKNPDVRNVCVRFVWPMQ
jgi:hypothetical protein